MRKLLLLLLFLSTEVASRPVSYPGGWTFMTMNDGHKYSVHTHYSPTANYSIGYKGEFWRSGDYQIHALQINNLLKRWNKQHAQANIYLKSGIGITYSDYNSFNSETDPVFFTGLAADWETRKYFISYENRITKSNSIVDNFRQKARIGFSPYVADFGNLHTWLMLEVSHVPEDEKNFAYTPLIRLFKGPSLLETGYSSEGKFLLNFVHRF